MLSAKEFTVGSLADAVPLSLILPRNEYEAHVLVGHGETAPAGVVLSGQYAFYRLEAKGGENWGGLVIPNVHIEVDENSLFSAEFRRDTLGSILRVDTQLRLVATRERHIGDVTHITLYDGLAPTGGQKAGFRRWQIVLGEGANKRVLWQSPEANNQGA